MIDDAGFVGEGILLLFAVLHCVEGSWKVLYGWSWRFNRRGWTKKSHLGVLAFVWVVHICEWLNKQISVRLVFVSILTP